MLLSTTELYTVTAPRMMLGITVTTAMVRTTRCSFRCSFSLRLLRLGTRKSLVTAAADRAMNRVLMEKR